MLTNYSYSWKYDIIVNLPLLGSKLYGKPPIWAGGGLPKGSPYSNGESGDPVERTWKIKDKMHMRKHFYCDKIVIYLPLNYKSYVIKLYLRGTKIIYPVQIILDTCMTTIIRCIIEVWLPTFLKYGGISLFRLDNDKRKSVGDKTYNISTASKTCFISN